MSQPLSPPSIPLLRTLGEVRLEGGSAALASRRKDLTLLAYLARRMPRSATRAELATLLWEDRGDAKARQSLRQALLDLKRLLGPGLVLDGETVRLESGLRVDAQAFEEELARGNPAGAVEWWDGDYLSGMDEVGGESFRGWVEAEREALRRQLAMACEQLIRDSIATGDRAAQLKHAERWAELRPLDEIAQRHVIEALDAAGRTAEARARHAAATARLQAEQDGTTPAFAKLGERLDRAVTPAPDARRIGSAALFTPDLIGREGALTELRSAWTEARAGARVIVLVEGDPGSGKSRLCEDFLLEPAVAAATPIILQAHPLRAGATGAADLLRQLLAPLSGAPGLAGAGPAALAELAVAVPDVRKRFPDLPPGTAEPAALHRAVCEVLLAVADERPIILFVDDVGALDPASRALVTGVLEHPGARLLAILTTRPEDTDGPSMAAGLRSLPRVRRLTLAALTSTQIEAMLGSMLALRMDDRKALAARLHAEGGGNPSYTVEMVSALVDDGGLASTATGSWHVAVVGDGQLPLPRSLREAIGRRLAQLDSRCQDIVAAAAVLGGVFGQDLLAEVAGADGLQTEAALGELLTRRLIRRAPGGDDTFQFVHELVARVAYERVPAARRNRLHRAAARAWRRRHPARAGAAEAAAHHRTRARAIGRIRHWPWWRKVAAAAGVLLVVGALAGLYALGPERRATLTTLLTRPQATLVPNRIVVAPLDNRTGDSTLAPIGDMAADWIARGLTQTGQFQVVDPRTSWLTAKLVAGMPRLLRPAELAVGIAQETGSGLVVSGSYYLQGDSLRFEVQITDVASHKLTRSLDPVSAAAGDASSVIPTLARRTVASVASAVDTQSTGMAAGLSQPPSYQAYDEVSRAWESFWRGDTTDLFLRTAHATALDSAYMPPRLMEAYVRSLDGQWAAVDSIVRTVETHSSRLTPVEQAIVAGLRANLRGDRPGRVRAARDLARLTPGSFEGYTLLAEMALGVGDPEQALDALSHVDPDRGLLLLSPIYWQSMARALHERGEYEQELETARNGVRRFPDDLGPQVAHIRALAALGKAEEVGREVERALAGDPDPVLNLSYRALAGAAELRTHGHGEAADRLLASSLVTSTAAATEASSVHLDRIRADLRYEAGRWADAQRHYAEAFARYPEDIESLIGIGVSASRLGNEREAARAEEQLASWPLAFPLGRNTYGRARMAALRGDSALAVQLLRKSFREGAPVISIWERHVHSERDFAGYRNYGPFRMLMSLP